MQIQDENGNVLKGGIIDLSKADTLVERLQNFQKEQDAAALVIGKFPEDGQIVTINGLKFKVLVAVPETGKLHLQIITEE